MPTEPADRDELSDVRALLADAKADQGPPLRISPQQISTDARRIKGRRRQLVLAGGTVAMIALVAVLATSLARPRVEPAAPGHLPAPSPPITTTLTHRQAPLPVTTRITPRTTVTTSGLGGSTPTP